MFLDSPERCSLDILLCVSSQIIRSLECEDPVKIETIYA